MIENVGSVVTLISPLCEFIKVLTILTLLYMLLEHVKSSYIVPSSQSLV